MLFKSIMILACLAIPTVATPVNITSIHQSQILRKRATPGFKKDDYTKQQITQIKQGHADAIKMASTVVSWSTSPDIFDPIFKKYFNILDRDAVVGKACLWSRHFFSFFRPPRPFNHVFRRLALDSLLRG
jgi:hypothetical protein